ncbi:heme A synthase [Brevibacillus fluminis]|uniref:Heme A synthase n=1 Tax=Brevibacillus fluminis TaxID=511487 RepID=A0A3M8DCT3_9BACL|nr:heme A synthase [Brevibacillus fluminis]RNB85950.1 heme A synthase [Brevibacillus fluminis]
MDRWLKWLAIFATIIMMLVMIAGSLVTKTNSGLGCGHDWPLCNGKWVPEYTLQSMIEYMHRFVTGLAGMVVVLFTIWAWRRYKGNKEVRATAIIGLFFIVLESLVGASAVIWPQSSPVLALHFGFSLLAYSGVFLLTLFVLGKERSQAVLQTKLAAGHRNLIWFTTIFAYGVVYLGAYVRHTGSNLGCPDWPLCQGRLIPELSGQVGIQFAHRLAAATLLFLLLAVMVIAIRHYKETRRDIYMASILSFVLVVVQVFSGGYVILSKLSLFATIFHSFVITCLFGVMCYLCLQSLKGPQKTSSK